MLIVDSCKDSQFSAPQPTLREAGRDLCWIWKIAQGLVSVGIRKLSNSVTDADCGQRPKSLETFNQGGQSHTAWCEIPLEDVD